MISLVFTKYTNSQEKLRSVRKCINQKYPAPEFMRKFRPICWEKHTFYCILCAKIEQTRNQL